MNRAARTSTSWRVNDLGPVETNAHLLQFDSVHGRFPREVSVKGDSISIGSDQFKVTAIKDPSQLPWKDLGVDIALECTGIFTARDKACGPSHRRRQARHRLGSRPTALTSPWSMASTMTSSPRTTW
jgi:glyceraldehyde 3-phosphate dehydrogenase